MAEDIEGPEEERPDPAAEDEAGAFLFTAFDGFVFESGAAASWDPDKQGEVMKKRA